MVHPSDLLPIGKITRVHGLRGALFLQPDNLESRSLEVVGSVFVGTASQSTVCYKLKEAAWMPRGWKIELEGLSDIETAQGLVGQLLFIDRNSLSPLSEKEYYVQDLVGCQVVTREGVDVGKVIGVEPAARPGYGTDRWWVESAEGSEIAIPSVKRYIVEVDVSTRKIIVQNIDELK